MNTLDDKLASGLEAMVTLACIRRCMRAGFSDETQEQQKTWGKRDSVFTGIEKSGGNIKEE